MKIRVWHVLVVLLFLGLGGWWILTELLSFAFGGMFQ
jgi:hypothetical protein